MSKLIPSAVKILTGKSATNTVAPVVATTRANYSTTNEAKFEIKAVDDVSSLITLLKRIENGDSTEQTKQTCSQTVPVASDSIIPKHRSISTYSKSTPVPADIKISGYKFHKLDGGPKTTVTVTSEEALALYHKLTVLRRLETAAGNLYKSKFVRGFCHLYSGEEAVGVGMHSVMKDVDTVITSYRCHGWTYLMGASAAEVLAELTGRQTGVSRGKGGSMHLYTKNFFGGNGIVGAQVPLGAGVAFAHKYKGDGGVCVTLYGDGAANQGQLFEAFNMAKLWSLPALFVCENNIYAMGTKAERSSASIDYYTRGDYIPGILVDGMDVIATREATRWALEYIRSGKGPLVLEMKTYRYGGHSMSDPGTSYRTREEVQEVRQTRDPITSFKEKITSLGLVTADQLKEIDAKVRTEIDDATKVAKTDSEVPLSEVSADVYVNCLEPEIRGVTPITPFKHTSVQQR